MKITAKFERFLILKPTNKEASSSEKKKQTINELSSVVRLHTCLRQRNDFIFNMRKRAHQKEQNAEWRSDSDLLLLVDSPSKRNRRYPQHSSRKIAVAALLLFVIIILRFDFDTSNSPNLEDVTLSSSTSQYNILPKKVYTVIGKESSGTKFVSEILRDALELHSYREGGRPFEFFPRNKKTYREDSKSQVQVQHFSLPQGSFCGESDYGSHHIVDVVLPAQCSSDLRPRHSRRRSTDGDDKNQNAALRKQCNDMTKELKWNIKPRLKGSIEAEQPAIRYPARYFLDINTHKDWYDSHGVEQYIIIVTRDENVSFNSRLKGHCGNVTIAEDEERLATNIINDAIYKYILEEDRARKTDLRHLWDPPEYQNTNNTEMRAKKNEKLKRMKMFEQSLVSQTNTIGRRKLGSLFEKNAEALSSFMPSKNRVVLVSYESLMTLQAPYVKMLFKQLGIESEYMPTMKDGNAKYVPRLREGDEIPMTTGQKKRTRERMQGEKDRH